MSFYAPTLNSSDDVKDRFCDTLYSTLRRISRNNKIKLLGNFIARVGRNHKIWQGVRMEVASSRPDHLPTLSIDKTYEFSLLVKSPLVAERSMSALLLRLLLQCASDIEMNPGPVSTPTPTNCLRLMQRNANRISGKNNRTADFPQQQQCQHCRYPRNQADQ